LSRAVGGGGGEGETILAYLQKSVHAAVEVAKARPRTAVTAAEALTQHAQSVAAAEESGVVARIAAAETARDQEPAPVLAAQVLQRLTQSAVRAGGEKRTSTRCQTVA